jgi:leader peptidase (prepilin peptidase)/N-methyltransferase
VLAFAIVSSAICLGLSPYLARLTLSVPDRSDRRWWRGRTASAPRQAATAGTALALGVLAGLARQPAFVWLALCATPLVVIDLEHHRLPDRLVLSAGIGGALLLALPGDWGRWAGALLGAAAVLAALAVLSLVGHFGFGDVKLGAALGLYLGWSGWSSVLDGLVLGFVLGGAAALGLLMAGRAGRKTAIAFGPWLTLGALLAPLIA